MNSAPLSVPPASPEAVRVSAKLSFGMQYRASYVIFLRSGIGIFFHLIFVIFPVLAMAASRMLDPEGTAEHPANWAQWLILPAIALIGFPLLIAWNIWNARRRNAWLHGTLTYVVARDFFQTQSGSFDVTLRWDVIRRAVETKHYVLLFVAGTMAHMIPKASVSSNELERMRAILREALDGRAKLLTGKS